jgi:hypothetical protein
LSAAVSSSGGLALIAAVLAAGEVTPDSEGKDATAAFCDHRLTQAGAARHRGGVATGVLAIAETQL